MTLLEKRGWLRQQCSRRQAALPLQAKQAGGVAALCRDKPCGLQQRQQPPVAAAAWTAAGSPGEQSLAALSPDPWGSAPRWLWQRVTAGGSLGHIGWQQFERTTRRQFSRPAHVADPAGSPNAAAGDSVWLLFAAVLPRLQAAAHYIRLALPRCRRRCHHRCCCWQLCCCCSCNWQQLRPAAACGRATSGVSAT